MIRPPPADASDAVDQADAELAMHREAAEDADDSAIFAERMAALREGREIAAGLIEDGSSPES